MSVKYKNPWFGENGPAQDFDPAFYETSAKPVKYKGVLIYNRIQGKPGRGCWDVVLNGICIAQYAGPNCGPYFYERFRKKDYRKWLKQIGAIK